MGNVTLCKETSVVVEEPTKVKTSKINGRGGVLQLTSDCKVRVCVVAYDYHGYGADAQSLPRLSCVRDGVRFAKMAKDSGAEVVEYYDRNEMNKAGLHMNRDKKKASTGFPQKQAILDEWRRIGSEMTENDAFVFYFAGHGVCSSERDALEHEGMMIFMEPDGTPSHLADDEVAAVLSEAFPKEAHILFITDCFHNSTVADLSRPALAGRPIVHMAAVKDHRHLPAQTKDRKAFKEEPSAFTQTLLETVQQLAQTPFAFSHTTAQDISVVEVYNKVLDNYTNGINEEKSSPTSNEEEKSPSTSGGKQDLYFARTSKFDPDTFRWPLLPPPGWMSSDPLDPKAKGPSMFACVG